MDLLRCRSIAFSLLTTLLLAGPCIGAQDTLKNEILASKHGRYKEALDIGQQIVGRDANNVLAHYYLADAYLHLGQLDKAAGEYSICNKLSSDKVMKSYCGQALKIIDQQNNANAAKKADESKASQLSHNKSHMQNQVSHNKDIINQEMKNELGALDKRIQAKIKLINDEKDAQIADVPKSFWVLQFEKPNPNYQPTVDSINEEAQTKIAVVNEELAQRKKAINQYYQKKLDAIDSEMGNTNSQLKAGTGTIQMTSSGSNLYVRNYVNYEGGDQPAVSPAPGLKAVPQILSQPSSKKDTRGIHGQ